MEVQEFIGKSNKRSKLQMLTIPAILLAVAGFWLFRIYLTAPDLLTLTQVTNSLIVVSPFYVGFIALDSIKKIVFKKSYSVFDVRYQVSERHVDVRFFNHSLSINISDIENVRDPEFTGQLIHFVLKSGKEYSLPAPDNKLELYQLLTKRIA
jgi:hypothetical protein